MTDHTRCFLFQPEKGQSLPAKKEDLSSAQDISVCHPLFSFSICFGNRNERGKSETERCDRFSIHANKDDSDLIWVDGTYRAAAHTYRVLPITGSVLVGSRWRWVSHHALNNPLCQQTHTHIHTHTHTHIQIKIYMLCWYYYHNCESNFHSLKVSLCPNSTVNRKKNTSKS